MPLKVMTVFGTRPEAIKVAPLLAMLDRDDRFDSVPVLTGQHREMLDHVVASFGILPSHDLGLMRPGQSLNSLVSRAVAGVDEVLHVERPDAVVVQGDTSTAMAAALTAFNRRVPVVHLEAGLRTGDLASPFPEEANRRLIAQVSALHLVPTSRAKQNLLAESTAPESIVVTGNTVIDALMLASTWETPFHDPRLVAAVDSGSPLILATTHRRENLGEGMEQIAGALADVARRRPDMTVVVPIHRNPEVRATLLPALAGLSNVLVTEPLSYAEFTRLMSVAHLVLTDSGGVQEEAPTLGKPVLVLRDTTERPEAVDAGTVRLVGTRQSDIVEATMRLLDDEGEYERMANAVNPYGDGRASERAVAAIAAMFGLGSRMDDFS